MAPSGSPPASAPGHNVDGAPAAGSPCDGSAAASSPAAAPAARAPCASLPAGAPPAAPPSRADCLDAVLHAARAEIYLIDAASLRLLDVNPAACAQLGMPRAAVLALSPFDLAPALDAERYRALLSTLGGDLPLLLRTEHRRADGSRYPLELSLLRRGGAIVAVGEDLTARRAAAAALEHSQARFNAIVSHTPGLVYQFTLGADGAVAFPYLSEGCQALLGLAPAELAAQPGRFLELILADDRRAYLDAMHASAAGHKSWNWEGRIWIDAWHDVKWINLRASPHRQPDGSVRWDGIMSNITASRLAQQDVRASRARLAELTAHIDMVKEHERASIAREIHDDLGGNLTAIKMALAMLERHLAPQAGELRDKAAYIDRLVDRSIDAIHRIALDLRPAVLDLGIAAALDWQLKEFDKQMGVACTLRCDEGEIGLDEDQATALFRIFQEALTNIAKHARASRVAVRLVRLGQHVRLTISDNGAGIAPADRLKPDSFGIRGMAERCKALGGTLTLSRPAGGGTTVAIKIRLAARKPAIIAAGNKKPQTKPQ